MAEKLKVIGDTLIKGRGNDARMKDEGQVRSKRKHTLVIN